MKKTSMVVICLVSIAFFASCDAHVQYLFKVNNATSQTLFLNLSTTRNDTFVKIKPGKTGQIFQEWKTNSGIIPYYKDTIWTFLNFEIVGADSGEVNEWIYSSKNWDFQALPGGRGQYLLSIEEKHLQ